ncbi:hypothetical protein GN958_ATG03404 [Phytophthora infestans]|uniref:Uncharacterized protein n=1 Tax=Phytophthora infestans TaxID=4787 RepID=A0A8S9V2F4_PHYIN|nr:hypothetical protein GN958_ATG12638 [Phytophthora infestans]KAF4147393.1 hypothetical protein GN958_ATG03402 [Phytophthora infestans]KAF4147395.1 hypothetical protein GN958_ATG03404 [Phytophthora infestans]
MQQARDIKLPKPDTRQQKQDKYFDWFTKLTFRLFARRMKLADVLRSRIERTQEKLLPIFEKLPAIVDMLHKATNEKQTDSTSIPSTPAQFPPCISLCV